MLLHLQQGQATAYIDAIKAAPDCWRLCIERFGVSQYQEVHFWCLQTLHEVGAKSICMARLHSRLRSPPPAPCLQTIRSSYSSFDSSIRHAVSEPNPAANLEPLPAWKGP